MGFFFFKKKKAGSFDRVWPGCSMGSCSFWLLTTTTYSFLDFILGNARFLACKGERRKKNVVWANYVLNSKLEIVRFLLQIVTEINNFAMFVNQ